MIRASARSAGKKYKMYPRRWSRLLEWATVDRYVGHAAHWALRDVSFEIGAGESVGLIGMNGAGKSTLLKMLAGTTTPTEGSVTVSGRVGALLELGLGMHPEFSGWQNAVLMCQLMGFERETIRACLPQIQRFSELGDAMDQPVRTYSTGMQVRLAFSAATAVRPDILIVDEALAVGDAYFQHKSMARIRSFMDAGMTLLFVTHDPAALKAVCRRALLLDQGRLLRDGSADAVFDYYNALIAQRTKAFEISQVAREGEGPVTRSGSREAEIVALEVYDVAGHPGRLFRVAEHVTLTLRIAIKRPMPAPTVGFVIRDRFGADVFGTNTYHLGVRPRPCAPGACLVATFEMQLNLGPGSYSLSAAVHAGRDHIEQSFDWWDHALAFQVAPDSSFSFVGVAALPTRARVDVAPDRV